MKIPEPILEIIKNMIWQNNYATSRPIYTIQKAYRIYGIDEHHGRDGSEFFNSDFKVSFESSEELEKYLNSDENEDFCDEEDFHEVGYKTTFETVQFFLTEEAAKKYIEGKGDKYRIYVISGWDNPEITAILEFLASIAKEDIERR